jgi:hypothetical protein
LLAKVAVHPIVGPPEAIEKVARQEFMSALKKRRFSVVGLEDATFILRPYVLATNAGSAVKVEFVLDVSEPSGKRINRFAGQLSANRVFASDAYSALTLQITQSLASEMVVGLEAWLSNPQ